MRASINLTRLVAIIGAALVGTTSCFSLPSNVRQHTGTNVIISANNNNNNNMVDDRRHRHQTRLHGTSDRRALLGAASVTAATAFLFPARSSAAPTQEAISTAEFESILKASYRSVRSVEFVGSKLDTATVSLIDGTTFGINDLVESSTDPRSPLRLMATLKGYNVPIKTSLGRNLASSTSIPKKTKVYMNSRVQEAAVKEDAKRERMRVDEEDRQQQLSAMAAEAAADRKPLVVDDAAAAPVVTTSD